MSKNKLLLIVFGILLAVYIGNKFIGSNKDRNFKSVLVELDTASVSKIIIKAKANNGNEITLIREGKDWTVNKDSQSDVADKSNVRSMLSAIQKLEPQRLIANSEEKWAQYEVNDSLGTHVRAYSGDKVLADVVIGKFNFNQQARTAATFVRLNKEKNVYTVEGFLASTFNQEFNSFRNKTFINCTPENLTALKFDYSGDSSFVLNKSGDKWLINDAEADSTSVAKFLNGLRRLNQREFVDDFSPSEQPVYTLTIAGNNMNSIIVKGYMRDDEIILNSSLNPSAYFKKGSLNVFEKLFATAESFKKM